MDSLVVFLLGLAGQEFNPSDWAPGFSALLRPAEAKKATQWRKKLTLPLQELVDQTEDWFPFVQELRNIPVHRRSMCIIFGYPIDRLAFQVTHPGDEPVITSEAFLIRPAGGPIVDFSLYGVWMLAEVVFFMKQVARVAMRQIGNSDEDLHYSGLPGVSDSPVVAELDRLIDRVARLEEHQPTDSRTPQPAL